VAPRCSHQRSSSADAGMAAERFACAAATIRSLVTEEAAH
jgi:hypothetical protein